MMVCLYICLYIQRPHPPFLYRERVLGQSKHKETHKREWKRKITKLTGAIDHRYLKWDTSVTVTKEAYLTNSCTDSRGGDTPTIVGEFSLSVPDDVQWTDACTYYLHNTKTLLIPSLGTPTGSANTKFYTDWFAAQIMTYEQQLGWIFWTWKSQLGDYRWSYQDAVSAGIIPTGMFIQFVLCFLVGMLFWR